MGAGRGTAWAFRAPPLPLLVAGLKIMGALYRVEFSHRLGHELPLAPQKRLRDHRLKARHEAATAIRLSFQQREILMRRRQFIAWLGSVVAWPLVARAQQPAAPAIGYLGLGSPVQGDVTTAAFRKGLSEMGYVEGRNLAIELWARNDFKALPELAADLVDRRVAVIVTVGTAAPLAAKALTGTIPIVFSAVGDPVQSGIVTNLRRPGGNITGISIMVAELGAKRLELLHELLPRAQRFGVLINPRDPLAENQIGDLRAAAAAVGREIEVFYAGTNTEIDTAFASLGQKGADALLVSPQILFIERRTQIIALAARHAVPVIYTERRYVEAGGLMSYGPNELDAPRQLGIYTGRVLKGEKPADLPIMRSTKFEFVINLQAAKVIGIDVPPTLLALADEVIE
jgi:putative tryptophan/tyrosine transport system substrate-binding protein